jgi:hypothetical protein
MNFWSEPEISKYLHDTKQQSIPISQHGFNHNLYVTEFLILCLSFNSEHVPGRRKTSYPVSMN